MTLIPLIRKLDSICITRRYIMFAMKVAVMALKYALLLLLFFMCNTVSTRIKIKAHFPKPTSVTESKSYLRSQDNLPDLQEFTLCFWIRPFATSDDSPIFRIGNFTLELSNGKNYHSHIKLVTYRYKLSLPNETIPSWNHICMSNFHPTKLVNSYINGKFSKITYSWYTFMRNFSPAPSFKGNPLHIGSNWLDDSSFYGDIADFHIWDEVLSKDQVGEAAKCGGKRKIGNVFAWMKTPMFNSSSVVFKETQLCEP